MIGSSHLPQRPTPHGRCSVRRWADTYAYFPVSSSPFSPPRRRTAVASSRPHPLDPLSPAEITIVLAAVLDSPLVPARPITFHYVGLYEPDKADVLNYAYGGGTGLSSRQLGRRSCTANTSLNGLCTLLLPPF
ncbi:hypothetical protein HU200_054729 [Digitaria exilis]|uniref:Copper amine oxidase N2-terminal domain-containing protein n=1 Tax=Digitaria exilis TaxID=1010633 RepID=A0A835AKB5_9POAL|nr:hypothetical protein HU200_054729 [Digitaria exilis]